MSPYEWHVNPADCEHSGETYIKGVVYCNKYDTGCGVPGVRVAMGAADGVTIYDQVTTFDDGTYSFTLSTAGQPAKKGTYYIWMIDGSGKRISDIGGPIVVNGLGPDTPGACWAGHVYFWK